MYNNRSIVHTQYQRNKTSLYEINCQVKYCIVLRNYMYRIILTGFKGIHHGFCEKESFYFFHINILFIETRESGKFDETVAQWSEIQYDDGFVKSYYFST